MKQPTKPMINFELLAPYNKSVQLMGSWNHWQPIPMKQTAATGVWHINVPLEDGEHEYKYQLVSRSYFAAGETVTVADPRAIEFTLDSHENSIFRVRDGKRLLTSYVWQHDKVLLPPNEQLVIYEMHIGDFGGTVDHKGNFGTLIEKLDYLADLGINAIELMPVNEFPGNHQWGYSLRSLYAVENSYGSPDDLCRLVDECHARGIRVIHDVVYNHMEQEAPLTRIDYGYWFYENNPDPDNLQFGPKFNYEYHDAKINRFPAREHVLGALAQWLILFHMDGLRFDCTRAIKYFELLHWLTDETKKLEGLKPFFTVAEHISQDPTIAGPEAPMNAAWHDNFFRQTVASTIGVESDGRNPFDTTAILNVMDGRRDGFHDPFCTVNYLANHDEMRLLHRLGQVANTFDDAAFRRAKLGPTLLLTSPGIPMIWMGEEFGQATDKSLEPRPLQWDLLANTGNKGLYEHYKALIHFRKNNPALFSDTFEVLCNDPARGIIAFKRWSGDNVVVVAAKLTNTYGGEFDLSESALGDGTWHEAVHGYDLQVVGGHLVDTLAEGEAKIYRRVT